MLSRIFVIRLRRRKILRSTTGQEQRFNGFVLTAKLERFDFTLTINRLVEALTRYGTKIGFSIMICGSRSISRLTRNLYKRKRRRPGLVVCDGQGFNFRCVALRPLFKACGQKHWSKALAFDSSRTLTLTLIQHVCRHTYANVCSPPRGRLSCLDRQSFFSNLRGNAR